VRKEGIIMPINVENEFKTTITSDQATALINAYSWNDPFTQTNTYFDTAKHALRNQKCAARIRVFSDHAEQTLKVLARTTPRKVLEYTDPLTLPQAAELVQAGKMATPGTVACQTHVLGVDIDSLHAFASATTTRRQLPSTTGLLVLDSTTYPDGFTDWELEMEYTDFELAKPYFTEIIQKFGIVKQPVTSKIARATAHTKN
jgi:uncharacterized protein YjbK